MSNKIVKIAIAIFILVMIVLLLLFLWSKSKPQKATSRIPKAERITNEAQAKLLPVGQDGLGGQVNLLEKNGQTTHVFVLLDLFSAKTKTATVSGSFTASIFSGTCDKPEETKFPLQTTSQFISATNLNFPLSQLRQIEPLVVNIRQTDSSKSTISCGKIHYRE